MTGKDGLSTLQEGIKGQSHPRNYTLQGFNLVSLFWEAVSVYFWI